jgi:hypothetical protein
MQRSTGLGRFDKLSEPATPTPAGLQLPPSGETAGADRAVDQLSAGNVVQGPAPAAEQPNGAILTAGGRAGASLRFGGEAQRAQESLGEPAAASLGDRSERGLASPSPSTASTDPNSETAQQWTYQQQEQTRESSTEAVLIRRPVLVLIEITPPSPAPVAPPDNAEDR